MGTWLTDKIVRDLPLPERGTKRVYDAPDPKGRMGWTSGFGIRVAAGGTKTFVLSYRSRKTRKSHLFSIGGWPEWSVEAARKEARELKQAIDKGADPQTEKDTARNAPTMGALCDKFLTEILPKRRLATQRAYRHIIEREIKPRFGTDLVAGLDRRDVEKMHKEISKRGAPTLANMAVAILSKVMSEAIRDKARTDNPCRGIERNPETSRRRYLTGEELGALQQALAEHDDQLVVNAITLMLLTGCRKSEALSATWDQFDLDHRGVWVKPAHSTKQRRMHETPISDAALALLRSMRKDAPEAVYLFPGRDGRPHRTDIARSWAAITKAAGINKLRVHDLRHSYASMLVSSGASLALVGGMLGHSLAQTTLRYAHLTNDVQREAANKVGAQLAGLVAKRPKGRKLKVIS